MKSLLFTCIILFGINYSNLSGQPIRFVKERIEIIVCDGYCKLIGTYYYENPTLDLIEMSLYYPFVINEYLPSPDSMSVRNVSTTESVKFNKLMYCAFFKIKVPPLSTEIYEVSYYQKTLFNRMEYIITKIKDWGEPLGEAEFLFKLPLKYDIDSLSYAYNKKETDSMHTTYYINKNNYMPERNLILTWKRKEN